MEPQAQHSKIRPPAVAGLFYAADARRLQATVSELLGAVKSPAGILPKALIAPHAGYVYSGPVAAQAFDARAQDVAVVLRRLWGGPETLIVVSSDLSHYHDYETARRLDTATAAAIERGEWESLGPNQACGFLAVAGLLVEASRRRLALTRLALCNSGDTAGGRGRVVGYGAWIVEHSAAAG